MGISDGSSRPITAAYLLLQQLQGITDILTNQLNGINDKLVLANTKLDSIIVENQSINTKLDSQNDYLSNIRDIVDYVASSVNSQDTSVPGLLQESKIANDLLTNANTKLDDVSSLLSGTLTITTGALGSVVVSNSLLHPALSVVGI